MSVTGKEILTWLGYRVAMDMVTTNNMIETAYARDGLTGLESLAGTLARIEGWQTAAQGEGRIAPVHAMLVGLRRFETINLAYGEAAGDSALVEVARRIQHFAIDEFEGPWAVSRAGGGNFLIAANEPCSRERWQWLAETLANQISRPIVNPSGENSMRLWPRMALLRTVPNEGAEALFDRLAETLGRGQGQSGRRMLWVDGDVSVPGRSAAQLEADLLTALDRDEIEILYQPQFSATDHALVGAEALARWQHPALGRIGAAALFAIAERADHVAQLSQHIAARALAGALAWPGRLRLSLNVTPADLSDNDYAEKLAAIVQESGFCPNRLTLEITEQAQLGEVERSATALARLVDLGMRVALDDFGAGFCNFRYLKLLPLHYLKLDRAMVDDIISDDRDLAVFRGIMAMARALDLSVIAEGIETEEQCRLIAAEGCQSYQGFLRAKPMHGDEFIALAKSA